MMAAPLMLNLGCGGRPLDGYTDVDLPDVDLTQFPWPWESGSVDRIYAGHIIEHFDRDIGAQFLREAWRVLRSGGVIDIATPDMDRFISWRLYGSPDLGGYPWRDLNDLLGGGQAEPRPEMRHRYMYCYASLAWSLRQAGFSDIKQRGYAEYDNPAYRDISLYVTARARHRGRR